DMMGRRDLVGWQKAIWAMVIVFFPWIGVFAYLIARPREATFPAYAGGPAPSSPVPSSPVPTTQAYTPQRPPTAAPTTAESTQASGDARSAPA
ncbi:MAG TPA: PLD nuclease N-terminal domain-containing protein, partial [Ktedonobacterales bacterium]